MSQVLHALMPRILATVLAAAAAFCVSAHAQVVPVFKHAAPVLPSGDDNVVRIMKISFKPGKASGWHQHPYPIYVYVVRGTVGLEFQGQERQEFSAGQGWHEPAKLPNRVVNLSETEPLELVMFQVSEAAAPFARRVRSE